jgi:hypothetical protein
MMGDMAGSSQPPGQMRDQDQVDIDQSVGQQNP